MDCPDENVLAGYVDGGLGGQQRAALQRHIDTCPACRAIVSDLVRMKQHNIPASAFASGRPTAATIEYRSNRGIHLVPGTMVGEYEVTGSIGAGGMGAVFSAIHPRIGKKAAIKVLLRELALDPSVIVRFENEARAVNAIGHPNIVDIFAFGELPDGNPYFVMEHVAGESLDKWLQRQGPLSLERAMPILRQIFDALAAAHEQGIIHRDLKPGNIMLSGDDGTPRITVLDFGLAKIVRTIGSIDVDSADLTMPGVAMGTPLFMSPEQYLGDAVDHRTDIYALGVLVYQMLCGEYPFAGSTPTAIGVQHITEPPRAPSSVVPRLPGRLDQIILKSLAKDPAERQATVRELRAELDDCVRMVETGSMPTKKVAVPPVDLATLPGRPGAARAASARPATPLPEPRPRRSWLPLALAFVATLGGGAIVLAVVTGHRDSAADKPETATASPTAPPSPTGPTAPSEEKPQAAPPAEPAPAPPEAKPVAAPAASAPSPSESAASASVPSESAGSASVPVPSAPAASTSAPSEHAASETALAAPAGAARGSAAAVPAAAQTNAKLGRKTSTGAKAVTGTKAVIKHVGATGSGSAGTGSNGSGAAAKHCDPYRAIDGC